MDIHELIARSEILALLNRYAHGVDRNDWPLVRACYHPDAHDDHGLYQGGVEGLMDFLASTAAHFVGTTHQLGNHLAEVDGDRARSETSCLAWYRRVDRQGHERAIAQGVRYLDCLERRDGHWAITHRVVVLDWEHVLETAPGAPTAASWQVGARGAADPSYGFFSSALTSSAGHWPAFPPRSSP